MMSGRPVGRCIGCKHDFSVEVTCGGCGAVEGPDEPLRRSAVSLKDAYYRACAKAEYEDDAFNWIWEKMPEKTKAGFMEFATMVTTQPVVKTFSAEDPGLVEMLQLAMDVASDCGHTADFVAKRVEEYLNRG